MYRSPSRIAFFLFLATLLAGLPGGMVNAAGAGTRVVIHLDAPAQMLRCLPCVIDGQAALIGKAVASFADDTLPNQPGTAARFLRQGAALGTDSFSGTAVDLREAADSAASGARHFIAL